MKNDLSQLELLLERYPALQPLRADLLAAYRLCADCYDHGGTLFTCGNGGSCADAEHIAGELLKGFVRQRRLSPEERQRLHDLALPDAELLGRSLQYGLPAVCLMSQTAILTAVANDLDPDLGPAQQLYALGKPGDVLLALSTSGQARNVLLAVQVAQARGMKVIGLTNAVGGRLAERADVCLKMPEKETYKVQELHLPVYHCLCMMLEARYFDE